MLNAKNTENIAGLVAEGMLNIAAQSKTSPMETPQSEKEVVDTVDKTLKELYYNVEDPESYGWVEKLFRSEKGAVLKGVTRGRV